VLSDHDVRSAIDVPQAPRTAAQIYGCLGCTPECGRCARAIRQIIGEGPKGVTTGSR